MITHDARRSLSRGNNPVPSPWLATAGIFELHGSRLRPPAVRPAGLSHPPLLTRQKGVIPHIGRPPFLRGLPRAPEGAGCPLN